MLEQQVALLKQFIQLCKANPGLLHDPKLDFYREYLESLGATIPPAKSETDEKHASYEEKTPTPEAEVKNEELEETLPPLELDERGVIPPEDDEPLPMGDVNKEVSDVDLEKAEEFRDQAMTAFSEGNFAQAVQYYTQAIELNPGSAILHAKRAAALIKLSKPLAAIRDCTKAIEINADSAAPYKFRGKAYRLLGKWLEAHKDLALACKLDYDDTANEWLREVEPNAKKLREYNLARERLATEKELRERQERVRRAQEANRKAAEEAARAQTQSDDEDIDFDIPGAGGPGGFDQIGKLMAEIMSDPEIKEAIEKDPSIITAMTEMMSNPASIMKHMNNPIMMKILGKLGSKFGGSGMPGFSFGGAPSEFGGEMPGGPSSASASDKKADQQSAPKKAPEPDLD